jgi:hypothetical protein
VRSSQKYLLAMQIRNKVVTEEGVAQNAFDHAPRTSRSGAATSHDENRSKDSRGITPRVA